VSDPRILAAIRSWSHGDALVWPDDEFTGLALEVFAHQYARVEPYRRFCDRRGATPDRITRWQEIPAVPTEVFKRLRLCASDDVVRTFRTSGTTVAERGQHHFGTLDYYRAAIFEPFRRFCLSDRHRIAMLVLAPSPGELEDSSLSFMLGELVQRFGHPLASGFHFSRDADGELGFDLDGLLETLDLIGGPVMLLGTAFAFVELFDLMEGDLLLPAGSRAMETGGTKGRTREVARPELYAAFEARLGLDPTHCVAEYSMTELSSQAYTDSRGRGVPWSEALFRTPPWARVVAVDAVTLEPVEPGMRGLLRWYDLANVDSVLAVQTSDVGVVHRDGGFELLGRASGAELRGCSLSVEEILG